MNYELRKDDMELIGKQWDNFKNEVSGEISRIIGEIELAYGPRDISYPSIIFNFNSKNIQNTIVNEVSKELIINLPAYCMQDDRNSLYQRSLGLAHELIHTITPSEKYNEVTRLEEGLATIYSEKYTNRDSNPPPNYADAREKLLRLLSIDSDIIKKLRTNYPQKKISEYSEIDIVNEIAPISLNDIRELTNHFY